MMSRPVTDLFHRHRQGAAFWGALALVGLAVVMGSFAPTSGGTSSSHRLSLLSLPTGSTATSARAIAPAAANTPALSLGVTATPHTICAYGIATCAAGAASARVTLTANAGGQGVVAWPNVQVAFVVETTLYDGVYDPTAGDPGTDPCAGGGGMPCEESNGVPFFVSHAQQIANAIATANPHSQVSFAMVDYFATCNLDDCDGSEYHVDIQNFVPSGYFGSEVQATFQSTVLGGGYVYSDSDFSDNILHSSVITAMYGTIIGSGLTWSNNTHHVIVWMGSSAPRDPSYIENYCASASDYASFNTGSACLSATCEPSYIFAAGVSPNCEGWVRSQDGNQTHSIAGLSKTAQQCTGSIGGVCTVDAIDLWATPTDPLSKGWPVRSGYGPGSLVVQKNVDHILLAGCDIAAATGGTWDGPSFFTCPDGQSGSLQYVAHGPSTTPNLGNPTLFNAFRQVGFGPVIETQVAAGTGKPIFTYVPFGNIVLSQNLQATAACTRNGLTLHTCQTQPAILHSGATTYLGWNWSSNKTSNVMYLGDSWTASFNVVATGPPFATVPVDACITVACRAGGSSSVNGIYTWASYVPYSNNTVVTVSFPLAQLVVQYTPPPGIPPLSPPAPPPVPPGIPIVTATPVAVGQPIGIGNQVGVGNVSLQATAAGFLGAGFIRVSMKNRPIAMKIAAKTGRQTSRFEKESARAADGGVGRFE
ncbi:MAG: hypothetical protein L3K19_08580 [Thermoplasmata archaeon]|nr:hypothetical protein [Thermoplasmata archaeon]